MFRFWKKNKKQIPGSSAVRNGLRQRVGFLGGTPESTAQLFVAFRILCTCTRVPHTVYSIQYPGKNLLWPCSDQGGINGEGAVPTQSPTQAFLTRLSLNSQLPEHTQHHRCWYTDQLWLHATKQPRTLRPRPSASSVCHIPAVLSIDEFCLRLPFAILLVPTSVSFSWPS